MKRKFIPVLNLATYDVGKWDENKTGADISLDTVCIMYMYVGVPDNSIVFSHWILGQRA